MIEGIHVPAVREPAAGIEKLKEKKLLDKMAQKDKSIFSHKSSEIGIQNDALIISKWCAHWR